MTLFGLLEMRFGTGQTANVVSMILQHGLEQNSTLIIFENLEHVLVDLYKGPRHAVPPTQCAITRRSGYAFLLQTTLHSLYKFANSINLDASDGDFDEKCDVETFAGCQMTCARKSEI